MGAVAILAVAAALTLNMTAPVILVTDNPALALFTHLNPAHAALNIATLLLLAPYSRPAGAIIFLIGGTCANWWWAWQIGTPATGASSGIYAVAGWVLVGQRYNTMLAACLVTFLASAPDAFPGHVAGLIFGVTAAHLSHWYLCRSLSLLPESRHPKAANGTLVAGE